MSRRLEIAFWWGVLMGALSFAAGPLTSLSEHSAIAALQIMISVPLFPGLVAGAMMGSLLPAAGINWLIHFSICYLVLGFLPSFRKPRPSEDTRTDG